MRKVETHRFEGDDLAEVCRGLIIWLRKLGSETRLRAFDHLTELMDSTLCLKLILVVNWTFLDLFGPFLLSRSESSERVQSARSGRFVALGPCGP